MQGTYNSDHYICVKTIVTHSSAIVRAIKTPSNIGGMDIWLGAIEPSSEFSSVKYTATFFLRGNGDKTSKSGTTALHASKYVGKVVMDILDERSAAESPVGDMLVEMK